jgi:hypothetical protein
MALVEHNTVRISASQESNGVNSSHALHDTGSSLDIFYPVSRPGCRVRRTPEPDRARKRRTYSWAARVFFRRWPDPRGWAAQPLQARLAADSATPGRVVLAGSEQSSEGPHNLGQRRHFRARRGQSLETFVLPFGEILGPGQQQPGGPTWREVRTLVDAAPGSGTAQGGSGCRCSPELGFRPAERLPPHPAPVHGGRVGGPGTGRPCRPGSWGLAGCAPVSPRGRNA